MFPSVSLCRDLGWMREYFTSRLVYLAPWSGPWQALLKHLKTRDLSQVTWAIEPSNLKVWSTKSFKIETLIVELTVIFWSNHQYNTWIHEINVRDLILTEIFIVSRLQLIMITKDVIWKHYTIIKKVPVLISRYFGLIINMWVLKCEI